MFVVNTALKGTTAIPQPSLEKKLNALLFEATPLRSSHRPTGTRNPPPLRSGVELLVPDLGDGMPLILEVAEIALRTTGAVSVRGSPPRRTGAGSTRGRQCHSEDLYIGWPVGHQFGCKRREWFCSLNRFQCGQAPWIMKASH